MLSRHALCPLLAALLFAAPAPVEAGRTWSFYFENDVDALSGENNDRFYTNGARLDVHWPVCALPDWLMKRWEAGRRMPVAFVPEKVEIEGATAAGLAPAACAPSSAGVVGLSATERRFSVGLRLGQSFYTPEDIDDPNLRPLDRPYAAWLYVGAVANWLRPEHMRTLQLDVGTVGPNAFGEEVQDFVHKNITDSREAQGWRHQIRNEPGILFTYEERWRELPVDIDRNGEKIVVFDVLPKLGVNLGNIFTQGSASLTARIGWNLPDDFGPPARIISVFEAPARRERPLEAYLFVAAEGRGVIRNIFLDGNTVRDSHSVAKEDLVYDLEWGFVARYKRFRLTYRRVSRSEEFLLQSGRQRFGSVNFTLLAKMP